MTDFILSEVKPSIFLLEFPERYDMCMFFLRYQEYYESPSPQFRGQSFQILDFMKWYSLEFGDGAFTYPIDWSGFNIPSYVVQQVHDLHISDKNLYDYEMWQVHQQCQEKVGVENKFYLIGVTQGNGALEHEIAHGFFYLNPQYQVEMAQLVKEMDSELVRALHTYLEELGYTHHVYVDEVQANMATTEDFTKIKHFNSSVAKRLMRARKPFQKVFQKYLKGDK
jgi:hypothetical protein